MNNRYIYTFVLLLIFMTACITPYYPNINKYENLLVVDGQLTNLKGPYKVKLSKTFKYDGGIGTKTTGEPVTGAEVKIIDNTGIEVQLKEMDAGEYSTVDPNFLGVEGKSYKVQIKLNGQILESDFELLKAPTPIDKFYWEYKPKDKDTPNQVQILLDTHDPTSKTRYYGWEFEETWKFRVPIDVASNPEWKICYKNGASYFMNIGTTIQRNNDIIDRKRLQIIDEKTNRLFIRYSIQAKQYSFSERTYNYFDELIKANQNQGTLFDVTPYSLVGNIKNMTNTDIPVLGYFVVAGATEKRIFIDRDELPKEFNPTDGFPDCYSESVSVLKTLTDYRQNYRVDSLMKQNYKIYDKIDDRYSEYTFLYLAKPVCFDCTRTGYNIVPNFWTEIVNK